MDYRERWELKEYQSEQRLGTRAALFETEKPDSKDELDLDFDAPRSAPPGAPTMVHQRPGAPRGRLRGHRPVGGRWELARR